MITRAYTYGSGYRIINFLGVIMALCSSLIGIIFILASVSAWMGSNTVAAGKLFLYFVGFSIWSPLVFVGIAFLYVDVAIDDTGLNLSFPWKTIHVNWDDILDIKSANVLGFPLLQKASIVITKNSLTPFHRIYGLIYGGTARPAFLVSSSIREYPELMKTIDFHRNY